MSDHDMDDRKNTTDQCQADPRTHSEKALDLIADRLRDVVLELRVGPVPDTLTEIRDRLPEPVDVTEEPYSVRCGRAVCDDENPQRSGCRCYKDDGHDGMHGCEHADWPVDAAPADVDPDEALAMDLYHASLLIPPVKEIGSTVWLSERDHEMWLGVARAAREHIETEREDAPSADVLVADMWKQHRRAEKAEADLADMTRQRDEAVKRVEGYDKDRRAVADRYERLRKDVERYEGGMGYVSAHTKVQLLAVKNRLGSILARDAERGQS